MDEKRLASEQPQAAGARPKKRPQKKRPKKKRPQKNPSVGKRPVAEPQIPASMLKARRKNNEVADALLKKERERVSRKGRGRPNIAPDSLRALVQPPED